MTERRPFQPQELSLEEREEYVEHARRVMTSYAETLQQQAEANKSLLEPGFQEFDFDATGHISDTGRNSVVWCDVDVSDGTKLRFHAFAASTGGQSLAFSGAGTFRNFSPSELVGDAQFYAGWVDFPSLIISWYKGNKFVGALMSSNLSTRTTGSLEGIGTWTQAPDGS